MTSRPPHTIPYSTGRLAYEEKDEKLAKIEKDIPLTPEIITYIIRNDHPDGKQTVPEDAIDISEENEIEEEEISDESLITLSERRPTVGRVAKSEILDVITENENIDENKEDSILYQKTYLVSETDEFSDDETEEVEKEKTFYDMEARRRELREQEEENKRYIQELRNNAEFLEYEFNDLRSVLNRDIKDLLKELRRCDDEDLEDLREDIEAILDEEDLSSIERLVDEGE